MNSTLFGNFPHLGRDPRPSRTAPERDHAAWYLRRFGPLTVWQEMTEAQALDPDYEPVVVGVIHTIEEWDATHPALMEAARPSRTGKPQPVDPETLRRRGEAVAFLAAYEGRDSFLLDLRADRKYGTAHFRVSPKMADAILRVRDREAAAAVPVATPDQPRLVEVRAWLAANAEGNGFAASLLDAMTRWGRLTDRQYAAVERNLDRETPPGSTAGPRASTGPVGDGWFRVAGEVYKVQKAVHGSGNLYAKRLVVSDGSGRWEYAPGMVRRLTEADRLSIEDAAAMGRLYGVCMVCGRTLTDETSIEAGIGPVCRTRLS